MNKKWSTMNAVHLVATQLSNKLVKYEQLSDGRMLPHNSYVNNVSGRPLVIRHLEDRSGIVWWIDIQNDDRRD